MSIAFRIAYGLAAAYLVLILLRVFMSWFSGHESGAASRLLTVTDPCRNIQADKLSFYGQDGFLLCWLIVLVVLLNILSILSISGKISISLAH